MPTLLNEEFAILTACELVETLKNLKKSKTMRIKPVYKEKLIKLANILIDALPHKEKQSLPDVAYCAPLRVKNPPPRVKTHNALNQPTRSLQPTRPTTIANTLITHQQSARNNKPTLIPPDDAPLKPPHPHLQSS